MLRALLSVFVIMWASLLSAQSSLPPEYSFSATENSDVRAALRQYDDQGHGARHTIHWAYPAWGFAAPRVRVKAWLVSQGFEVFRSTDRGWRFEHSVDPFASRFDPLTPQVADGLMTLGWEYTGWETQLIKE